MINRLVFSLAVDSLNNSQKPAVDYRRCINRLQKQKECEICRSTCHKGAISYDKQISINPELCAGCHLCSGVCPTRCISTHDSFLKSNNMTEGNTLTVSCKQNGVDANRFKVFCLASLPWEFYAYFSYKAPIKLVMPDCEDCSANSLQNIIAINERLKMFWGDEYKHKVFISYTDEVIITEEQYSRREFFNFLPNKLKKAKKSVESSLEVTPDARDKPKEDEDIFRKLLIKELSDKKHPWYTLTVEDTCWGCAVCEKLCPSKAIEIINNDGQRALAHDVFRCTNCGVCKVTCPEKSIGEDTIHLASKGENIVQTSIISKSCETCGCSIKPNGPEKCGLCKSNRMRSKYAPAKKEGLKER